MKSKEAYTLIMSAWNMFLVRKSDLASRPNSSQFSSSNLDRQMRAVAEADERWLKSIPHFYARPELLETWGFRHGWGSKTKDVHNVFEGEDFEVFVMDTILHAKIARGAPTVHMNGMNCAMPVMNSIRKPALGLINDKEESK